MARGVGFGDCHAAVAWVGAGFVAAAGDEMEGLVDIGDAVEIGRPVPELFSDEMDHDMIFFAHALDATADTKQPRSHDDAAVRFEDLRPDHEIGDAVFVLDGNEYHTRSGSRPLSHQHQASEGENILVL